MRRAYMIGREHEKKKLLERYERQKAEFVAVYGRRRVGKTFLIDETFEGKFTFKHAGLSPVEIQKKGALTAQLDHFYYSLLRHGVMVDRVPTSWMEAFFVLETWLEKVDDGKRQVVFIDELPWLDTPRSGFVTGLEGFWNTWGCHRKNLMLIVCGSASSWILDHLINNHGGLYNRITCEIRLAPFTLGECEAFFKEKQVNLSRYDIIQSYMILGGIPYYLDYFERGLSLAQNIDLLFFSPGAVLENEYDRLFSSIFSNPSMMKSIVELLFSRNAGYTRKEICEKLHLSSGSIISSSLNALVGSGFVIRYVPFGMKKTEEHYKLVDPFCLFYLHFLHDKRKPDPHFWMHNQNMAALNSWRGFAFEHVCFNHIDQIKQALGISGVRTTHSAWSKRGDDPHGMQIDLLIERDDHVVNACEIKFYSGEFTVDKAYDRILRNRQLLLAKYLSPKISIYPTLITTYGLTKNEYSGFFVSVVTMDDLF